MEARQNVLINMQKNFCMRASGCQARLEPAYQEKSWDLPRETLPLTDRELITGFANPSAALQILDNRKNKHQGPEEQIILSAEKLSYNKAGKDLIRNISFSVKTGEFVAIAGSNGSGKTTLSRLLAGLSAPSKGNILFNDRPLSQWKEQELRQKSGYVFQNPEHQFIADSVYAEIAFSLKIQQIPEADIQKKFRLLCFKWTCSNVLT